MLSRIHRLRRKHRLELEKLHGIEVLRQHPAIKRAVSERGLSLHGLIYDIGAGQLRVLEDVGRKRSNGLWSPS
jgi:carbonic anhydrase